MSSINKTLICSGKVLSLLSTLLVTFSFNQAVKAKTVSVLMCGDIMPGGRLTEYIESYGTDYPFSRLTPFLNSIDCLIANLETPIIDVDTVKNSPPIKKRYNFNLPSKNAQCLLLPCTQIFHLANNHILDWGIPGVDSTLSWCRKHGIRYAGVGKNIQKACEPIVIELDSIKIGFIAFNMTFPKDFWATDSTPGTAYPYRKYFSGNLRKLAAETDFVVCSFHWGMEKMRIPKDYQKIYAHLAVENGADIVIGHHPHVIQPIEIYQGKLIFYSLGNFLFGSYSEAALTGLAVEALIEKDDLISDSLMVKYSLWLIDTDNRKHHFQPERSKLIHMDNYFKFDVSTGNREIMLVNGDTTKINLYIGN